ncbi:MAG: type II toxin-antitoxin system death-on-curing family toxin [Planctomycetota bacterium]
MNAAIRFLSVDDVLTLHAIAIEDQGGDPSLRDRGLLESAVAMPMQQFGGSYLHADIPAMAVAYAFHICMNHAFVDGNKRAATAAMIAFLSDNGWSFDAKPDEAEPVVRKLASGELDKAIFTDWARLHMHEKPKMELRDYFNRIDAHEFTKRLLSLLPGETGAKPDEFIQRVREATTAMPFLSDLARQQGEAKQAGDLAAWREVTMLAVGMMTLYVIAEDMGYEW